MYVFCMFSHVAAASSPRLESAIHADNKENGAIWRAIAAQREAAFGNAAEAKQDAAEALKLDPTSQGVQDEAVLAFAMAGDTARAESLAQDLNRRRCRPKLAAVVARVTIDFRFFPALCGTQKDAEAIGACGAVRIRKGAKQDSN